MKQILLIFVGVILITSCSNSGSDQDKIVTIKTIHGDLKVILYDETPLHKENFIRLAEEGRYDSTIFHRVIKNFMIQGGDIFRNKEGEEADQDRIQSEITNNFHHVKGSLAAARQSDQVNPDKLSSSCQFYIVHGQPWEQMSVNSNILYAKLKSMLDDTLTYPELAEEFRMIQQNVSSQSALNNWVFSKKEIVEETFGIDLTITPRTADNEAYETAGAGVPHLDGNYTVFGRVVEGLDVIDKIADVEVYAASIADQHLPRDPVYISMEVNQMTKSEITKKYGYNYPEGKK